MTVTGPVAACDSLTVKVSWLVPELPSLIEASPIEIVGTAGGGGGGAAPLTVKCVAVVSSALVLAWNPKVAWLPAATLAFHAALLTT